MIWYAWNDKQFSNDEKSKHLYKIQTENLRVKNPNSLNKIQHHGDTIHVMIHHIWCQHWAPQIFGDLTAPEEVSH